MSCWSLIGSALGLGGVCHLVLDRSQGPRVNKGVNASADRNLLGGHPVYSAWFEPGMGYRTPPGPANGTAVGEEAESMYATW